MGIRDIRGEGNVRFAGDSFIFILSLFLKIPRGDVPLCGNVPGGLFLV
jgi:hypothetical protein